MITISAGRQDAPRRLRDHGLLGDLLPVFRQLDLLVHGRRPPCSFPEPPSGGGLEVIGL